MITQQQIEEYGRVVSDAKHSLSMAEENLNKALIEYWHQETGAKEGDKYLYNGGLSSRPKEVIFSGFYIEHGRVRTRLMKVKKDGTASQNSEWCYIDTLDKFKQQLTKL